MKKVVLFTLTDDAQEMHALLDTLGAIIIREWSQQRRYPHPATFLGPGKIDEVEKDLKELEYDLIVVNGTLKPSQHRTLEVRFQKECIDRSGVILRIFADHAHTPEAIAQVTLAKLRYELPFLREWVHNAKKGDRPGFLAGGTYATDVYFEHAKSHARRIEVWLEDLSKQREVTRIKRRRSGYTSVSLAGYTNAGKSALMNKLSGSSVEVDSRLFSTLSTTTRRVPGVRGNVLMTDTVGFIKDLPHDLVDAFNSTLEEMFHADLILLIFDASEDCDMIKLKIKTSMDVLKPKMKSHTLLFVANKIDLVSRETLRSVRTVVEPMLNSNEMICVSAVTGEGLDVLRERIMKVQGRSWHLEVNLPLVDRSYAILSRIRGISHVETEVAGESLHASIRCRPEDSSKIVGWLESTSGKIVFSSEEETEEGCPGPGLPSEEEGPPLLREIR